MKNPIILFVAPSSYPIYGAEANVNAKICKLLAEEGCIIDLVSRAPRKTFHFYPPSNSDFFFSKLNSIHIVDVDTAKDFKTIIRHFKTFLKTTYFYIGIDWAFEAIKVCENLIKNKQYDFIYTYDYPSEVVGLYLTKKYGIKWVSTWNDPYMWVKYPLPYGKGSNAVVSSFRKRLIADMGIHTYRNIFPSNRLRDYMLSYMTNMSEKKCLISPHVLLNELQSVNNKKLDDTLKIIHTGALGKERDPQTLIKGLSLFLKKRPNAQIKLSFLGIWGGVKMNYINGLINDYNVNNFIEYISPVEYAESLDIVKQYDVCLLLEAACEIGIFLPSKVVDYMQNNKPILALSPMAGVIHDMFEQNEIDYFADVTNYENIAEVLDELYSDFKQGIIGKLDKLVERYCNEAIMTTHRREIFDNL